MLTSLWNVAQGHFTWEKKKKKKLKHDSKQFSTLTSGLNEGFKKEKKTLFFTGIFQPRGNVIVQLWVKLVARNAA